MTRPFLRIAFGIAAASATLSVPVCAQGPKTVPQSPGPHPHDISAFWELRDEPGYGGMALLKLDKPVFVDGYEKMAAEERDRYEHAKPGEVVGSVSRYCLPIGVPFIMGQSPPIDIVQGKDEILIFSEQHSSARHIYMDGRPHPSAEDLELTSDGHSIGHWDGDTLVVDTIGFRDDLGSMMPGGGGRGHTSHLVERFHLIDNGNKLTIESTWTDPRIYTTPRHYELTFFKSDGNTFAMDEFCDAGDAKQGQSIVAPKQK